jgi:hypothetical protein
VIREAMVATGTAVSRLIILALEGGPPEDPRDRDENNEASMIDKGRA